MIVIGNTAVLPVCAQ